MRILALITESFGGIGGIAQSNQDLLKALAETELGNEIVVLPRFSDKKIENLPNRIKFMPPQRGRLAYGLFSFGVLMSKGRFDMIFCGHIFMSPLAAFLSDFARIPFWAHLYGVESWQKPSSLIRRSVEKAKFVTAISRYTRRRFLSWANVAPGSVHLLPPVLHERFSPGPKPIDLIKRYGFEGKKVLLTVGRLSKAEKYKGHDKVIKVLPRLVKSYPDLVYAIAGDGDDRPRLENWAKQCGVDRHVFFMGEAEDSELPLIYRMADGFAMPSTGEGFGIVFLEAAASGVPVLGGNQDGSTDALLDGEFGLMVNPENEEDLIQGLEKLLIKKTSLKEPRDHFSYLNFKQQLQHLLKE